MKKSHTRWLMALTMIPVLFMSVACSDGKSPEKGYVSVDTVKTEIIDKASTINYTTYSYKGTLQYLAYDEELVPASIDKSNKAFTDSPNTYNVSSTSYYLNVPLHLTSANWQVYNEDGTINDSLSTKYRLESRIYQPNGGYLDTVYYYLNSDGGFSIKAFGVNKALRIVNPSDVTAHGKWNVVITYDKNGYLMSESFETLNARKEEDSKTIYGKCEYTFVN